MIRRVAFVLGLLVTFASAPISQAAMAAVAQAEVHHLLAFVEGSGCRFFRNDVWYDPPSAADHLRQKYEWLATRDRIATAEDFIDKAATKSSLTGRAYQVQCSSAAPLATASWLRTELARYRTAPRAPP
jgi:hypothetical protein